MAKHGIAETGTGYRQQSVPFKASSDCVCGLWSVLSVDDCSEIEAVEGRVGVGSVTFEDMRI